MTRRWLAAGILLLWIAGLGLLARRELLRPDTQRLAEIGLRVSPGALFYAAVRDGRHVGYASSTIDTTPQGLRVDDYIVADIPLGGRVQRGSARTVVNLSRDLRLRDFAVELRAEQGPITAEGRVEGDSVMQVLVRSGDAPADTQRVALSGPVLLPTLVPLAVMLGNEVEVGGTYTVPVFDPIAMAVKTASVRVAAESLFVENDSAVFDPSGRRWQGALPDTVRAFQLVSDDPSLFSGWVDEQGLVVRTRQLNTLDLVRMPYELAFENWQIERRGRGDAVAVDPADDILETTAIAADVGLRDPLAELRVRLRGVSLTGFQLDGPGQTLRGDTLVVTAATLDGIAPNWKLGTFTLRMSFADRDRWREFLRAEPLLETGDPDIRGLAMRLRAANDRDPLATARALHEWVRDSIRNTTTFGVPSARAVLEARAGDCNEHTQLYVALARAAGLPARIAAGLVRVNDKFYYHAWPEVYLDRWVGVDPTLGQYPADASHLRFVIGGLGQQAALLRLINNLEIDVLSAR